MNEIQRRAFMDCVIAERNLKHYTRKALGLFSNARLSAMTAEDRAALREAARDLPESTVREQLLCKLSKID